MNIMNITSAQWTLNIFTGEKEKIKAVIDNIEWHVPIDNASARYKEIVRQVEAGELTIKDAD